MKDRIFDGEYKLLEIIWDNQPISAKEISLIAAERIGWKKNTTYTVLTRLEAKGCIRREEPNFMCTALVSREEARRAETESLIDRLFGGSRKALFSALLEDESISEDELSELRRLIDKK